ncbi:MAG: ATP-dependent helicase [Anaerolineaceae bacterium]|nr:ATP-dependent helicase [Anaerolineaceae bacterium]
MFNPRPQQAQVIAFRAGKMGVSAVPGSGKTHTLSHLAAQLILEGYIKDNQEVLVVTLVNSAVENFLSRIKGFLGESGLIPGIGYRIRTLHGLAHDIVRERPDLAGLSNKFQIVDEHESENILRNAVNAWLRGNPQFISDFSSPNVDPFTNHKVMKDWHALAIDIARSVIRLSKDRKISPLELRRKIEGQGMMHPLLELGCQIYTDYQQALAYRSAVDFDDLIWFALNALQTDSAFLERLRYRWPYVLEDEAQDSSRLQEQILRTLAGEDGNWVRVGDPNQAIFETFTTASPEYLKNFIREPGVEYRPLSNSGRSTSSIIRLANHLIQWTNTDHPHLEIRDALTAPLIEPSPSGDPQPNPPDDPEAIYLSDKKWSPDRELKAVADSLARWLPENQDKTVAVLVPRNERGARMVEELKGRGIPYMELLRSSLSTRQGAEILSSILKALANPTAASHLSSSYSLIRTRQNEPDDFKETIAAAAHILADCKNPEDFLWPSPGRDLLAELASSNASPALLEELEAFRMDMRRWQAATLLPIDELVLTISQDIFKEPGDLALAHKLALLLESVSQDHPDWHLEELQLELEAVAKNQRKFLGFSDEDTGFNPDAHPGKVVVATIHKAKGLEWDRVHLLSVNNYDFPSAMPYDSFISEKWFVRGKENLQAQTISLFNALFMRDAIAMQLEGKEAASKARLEYAAERLRLLFVAITRARRELIITWNTGRAIGQMQESQPALPLAALQAFWKENQ